MKIMVASDIHGSDFYCEKMIDVFNREGAEKLLLLGDILYHGPRNDLPEGYAPKAVIERLNAIKDKILAVRGNCDTEVDQMVFRFPILADYCILYVGGRMIYATHGHNFNCDKLPPIQSGDILLHGHTHVPKCEDTGDFIYMNPGSVSIPKEGSQHGYIILTEEKAVWKSLSGKEYMEYKF